MADNIRAWAGRNLRLPSATDAPPANRHLAGICAWAALIGLAGMLVAVAALHAWRRSTGR
jgi:hypothetical protein